MTVTQGPGPLPLVTVRTVVEALIGESDRRSSELGRRLAAWRDGYERGLEAGSEVGYGAAAFQEAAQRREAAGLVAEHVTGILESRWKLRGERRTRATFAAPHRGDYAGGPVAW